MKKFELVVTRHTGLVEYLFAEGLITSETEVSDHATPEMVVGKRVCGVLPHALSCLCKTFTEIPLALTAEMRGKELSCADVRRIAGPPATYRVAKLQN